jgi:hypothetical protein
MTTKKNLCDHVQKQNRRTINLVFTIESFTGTSFAMVDSELTWIYYL